MSSLASVNQRTEPVRGDSKQRNEENNEEADGQEKRGPPMSHDIDEKKPQDQFSQLDPNGNEISNGLPLKEAQSEKPADDPDTPSCDAAGFEAAGHLQKQPNESKTKPCLLPGPRSAAKEPSSPQTEKSKVQKELEMKVDFYKSKVAKLEKILAEREIFLNMVIHDLRNPTNAINQAMDIALAKVEEAERAGRAKRNHLEDKNLKSKAPKLEVPSPKKQSEGSTAGCEKDENDQDLKENAEQNEIEHLRKALEERDETITILKNKLALLDSVKPLSSSIHQEDERPNSDSDRVAPILNELRSLLQVSKHSSTMLLTLINDLLDSAKIKECKFNLNETYFNLEYTINSVFKALDFHASSKSIKTSLITTSEDAAIAASPSSPLIFGDPHRYEQVLLNLVSNALKFGRRGGEVQVQVSATKTTPVTSSEEEAKNEIAPSRGQEMKPQTTRLVLKVIDNGPGISKVGQRSLFQDFGSLDEHRSSNFRGTGLGLSICKKIVEQMGGQIKVQSQLGKGTTFIVELTTLMKPAHAPASSFLQEGPLGLEAQEFRLDGDHFGHSMTQRERQCSTEQEDLRVLLVNDEPGLLMIMEIVLKFTLGLTNLTKAYNGLEAFEMVTSSQFDLVLMDINMPVLGGFDAAKKIKDHFTRQEITSSGSKDEEEVGQMIRIPYLVAVSAEEATPELEQTSREYGFDDLMEHPLQKTIFQTRILDKVLLMKRSCATDEQGAGLEGEEGATDHELHLKRVQD